MISGRSDNGDQFWDIDDPPGSPTGRVGDGRDLLQIARGNGIIGGLMTGMTN